MMHTHTCIKPAYLASNASEGPHKCTLTCVVSGRVMFFMDTCISKHTETPTDVICTNSSHRHITCTHADCIYVYAHILTLTYADTCRHSMIQHKYQHASIQAYTSYQHTYTHTHTHKHTHTHTKPQKDSVARKDAHTH